MILLLRSYGPKLYAFITALLFAAIPGLICIGLQGRPEHLAPLIFCFPILAFIFTKKTLYRLIFFALSASLLIVLSPLSGLIFILITMFFIYGNSGNSITLFARYSLIFGLIGFIFSFLLIIILSPFSPFEWIQNMLSFGSSEGQPNFSGLLINFRNVKWGASLIAPGWNFLILLFTAIGSLWLWRSQRSLISMMILGVIAILINERTADYGYVCFIPFALAICLNYINSPWFMSNKYLGVRLLKSSVVLLSALSLFVITQYLAVSRLLPHDEVFLQLARNKFNNSAAGQALFSNQLSAVGFPTNSSPSLVVFGDADDRLPGFNYTITPSSDEHIKKYEITFKKKVEYYIVPQIATSKNTSPPESVYVGSVKFDLINNFWSKPLKADIKAKPSILTNRYNYAIYKRHVQS